MNLHALYELPGDNEPNTFNVDITDEMSPKDVMDKVLEISEKFNDENEKSNDIFCCT